MSDLNVHEPLLEMREIAKRFPLERGFLRRIFGRHRGIQAVAPTNLLIRRTEIVGLVGESGSGKTTLAQIAARLVSPTSGQLIFAGTDVTRAPSSALREFRKCVQMVFQDSASSLNPRKRVRRTLSEALKLRGVARRARYDESVRIVETVGLRPDVLGRYPHQLSGGQRQRVGIARALAMQPSLLIADEPVSSLDVSLQSQIINLLSGFRAKFGLAMLFISHDLALVGFMCDRIAVMYGGYIVEEGMPREVLRNPVHPYTKALIAAVPSGLAGRNRRKGKTAPIFDRPSLEKGCPYVARCQNRLPHCSLVYPTSITLTASHRASCHLLQISESEPKEVAGSTN